MNKITYGALKRIIKEVKEKRKATCLMKDCIINDQIYGNDIDLVESWIDSIPNLQQEIKELKAKIKQVREAVIVNQNDLNNIPITNLLEILKIKA